MRKLLPLVALAAVAMAAPASAQWYDDDRYDQREDRFEWRLDRIEERIERQRERGAISDYEAEALDREADWIDEMLDRYDRYGLSREEARLLQDRMRALRERLRGDRRDRDGWSGDRPGYGYPDRREEWRDDRGLEEWPEEGGYGREDAYGAPRLAQPGGGWEERFDENGWERDRWDQGGDPMIDDSDESWFYGDAPPPD